MTPFTRNVLICSPFLAATLIPYIKLADWLGTEIDGTIILLGALGWWLALLLRIPVMLIAKRRDAQRAQVLVTAASGPAEESVRLIMLLALGLTVDSALSLGLGWAAIEIVYSLIQGIMLGVLSRRTDPDAQKAKEFLELQGLDRTMQPAAPFWGVAERLAANAVHLSFSLLLVVSPWLVLMTMPVHSALNFLVARLLKRSFLVAEGIFVTLSLLLLAASLQMLG